MPSRDKNKHKPRHHRHAVQPSIKPMPPLPGATAVVATAASVPTAAPRGQRFRIAEPKADASAAPVEEAVSPETTTEEN